MAHDVATSSGARIDFDLGQLRQVLLGDPLVMPDCTGKFEGKLVIAGSGRCLMKDLDGVGSWDGLMALNRAGVFLDHELHHWFSYHGAELPGLAAERRESYGDEELLLHTISSQATPGTVSWPISPGGTSALGAAIVGLALGYSRIALCGCPLDGEGHFYDPPEFKGNHAAEAGEIRWRNAAANVFRGRVRSMSGRTREWLGPA